MSGDQAIHSTITQVGGGVVRYSPLLAGLALPLFVMLMNILAMAGSSVFNQRIDSNTRPPLMGFLLIVGMTLASSTMIFGSFAARWFGSRMKVFHFALIGSTLASMLALTVCGMEIATKFERYHAHGQTLFACFLVFVFSIPMLRLAVGYTKHIRTRIVTLSGFVAATVWIQYYLVKSDWDLNDEQAWSLNSMLIGLAFDIALGAWGAKEFRRN